MTEKPKKNSSTEQPKRSLNPYVKYSGIAFQMIVIILLGLFAGIKSDAFFKLEFPAFTLALTLLALGVALYILFRDVK